MRKIEKRSKTENGDMLSDTTKSFDGVASFDGGFRIRSSLGNKAEC